MLQPHRPTEKAKHITLMLGKTEGKEGGGRGWDGRIASPTQRTWIWANSRRKWRTEEARCAAIHGVGQKVRHDWVTELSWMTRNSSSILKSSLKFFLKKISFDMDHFKSLYWICYNIASVPCFGFLAVRHVGSLATQPEIEPVPPVLKVLTIGPPGSPFKPF